ncbi:IS4 family transposase [Streptomyces sp. NPDC059785]|uniref:IS4 family transposase n=1 Tax=Streptomyces sp. NPDC059785 TaxID=3346945 RepID=UPI003658497C
MHPWIGRSDDVRLGALTSWVTPELVDGVLAECGRGGVKPGALSPRFMVYFTLALALFAQDSYDDVAENLVGALEGMDKTIPSRASFTRARQRLGPEVLEAVFRRVRGPVAPAKVGRAFWRGMRLAAVDGFVLDLPDNKANREFFGGWSDARGAPAGFPQVRVVTLTETGTRASIDARIGGFNGGERELAVQMASSAAWMLVIMDRNFPGVELWKTYTHAGAHLLLRARSTVASRPLEVLADGSYLGRMSLAGQRASHPGGVTVRVVEYRIDGGELIRLLTDLLDVEAYLAAELAALHHDRWEAESASRQGKTFQRGPGQVLRSATPALVHQEVWAHLVVHHCLNGIIMQVADGEETDPHRISFVKVLKHVRRSVIRQAKDAVSAVRAFLAMLEAKVRRKLDTGPRRSRSAPRVLKRPDSRYSPSVKKQQHGPTRQVPAKVITPSPAMLQ